MDKHRDRISGRADPSPRRSVATLVTTGAVGAIMVLGAGAACLLTQASPEALAATSNALLTTGLVGLLLMALFVAVRLFWTATDQRGGHGRGGDQPPEPGPGPPMDDIDAEFFRIVNEERPRDIRVSPTELGAGPSAEVRARIWRGSPC